MSYAAARSAHTRGGAVDPTLCGLATERWRYALEREPCPDACFDLPIVASPGRARALLGR